MGYTLTGIVGILGSGFLLGLSAGPYCLGYCGPIIIPYMLGEGGNARQNCILSQYPQREKSQESASCFWPPYRIEHMPGFPRGIVLYPGSRESFGRDGIFLFIFHCNTHVSDTSSVSHFSGLFRVEENWPHSFIPRRMLVSFFGG